MMTAFPTHQVHWLPIGATFDEVDVDAVLLIGDPGTGKSWLAELLAYLTIVERTTAHSIRFTGGDMVEVFKFLEFMLSYRADLEP